MAEQIITLGIGATPANLTPFITTGLEIGIAVAAIIACADVTVSLVVTATAATSLVVTATATVTECD